MNFKRNPYAQMHAIVVFIVVLKWWLVLPFKKNINVVNHLKRYFKISLLFALLIIGKTSYSQLHPILDRFDIFEASGKVYISCVISSGSTCNGIDVLRSDDSVNFISVGHIGGVCGSSSVPVTYNFIDENPIKNKPIYYKLELGGYGFTNILPLQIIDTKEFGFQIRPNPASESAIIYFQNPTNTEHTLSILNNLGITVLSKKTNQNFFLFEVNHIPSGIYPFIISIDSFNNKVFGKIVIQH